MARGYPITVRATDSHDGTFDKDFFITVTDVAETPPDDPLPPGEDEPDDPGNFDTPPYTVNVDGGVKLAGKKKANGSIAKFIHDVYAEVPLEAGTIYTMKYDPDFTLMSQGGVLAMIGFMFKAGNDFYLVGLRGDGSTGIHAYEVQGDNLWNQTAGFVTADGGAAANGSQAGPNWIQLETSADGTTITFRTSGDDGETWDDKFTDVDITPFADIGDVTAWGPGAFFHGDDDGPYSILVELWTHESPVEISTAYGPHTFTSAEAGYAGYTVLIVTAAANLAALPSGTGTFVRITLTFSALSAGATMSAAYWGEQSGGGVGDFNGNQNQITFGGSNQIVGDGTTLVYVSDWCALGENYDEAQPHVFAAQFNAGGTVDFGRILSGSGGDAFFYKFGADAATTDKSGYSLQISNTPVLVSKVEIATGDPG